MTATADLIERLRSGATRCEHLDEMLQADDPCRWGGAETLFWATDMRAAADTIAALLAELDARTDPNLAKTLLSMADHMYERSDGAWTCREAARLLGGAT